MRAVHAKSVLGWPLARCYVVDLSVVLFEREPLSPPPDPFRSWFRATFVAFRGLRPAGAHWRFIARWDRPGGRRAVPFSPFQTMPPYSSGWIRTT